MDSNFDSYTLAGLPDKYEAGIQNYAAAIGFRKAVEYLERIGEKAIKEHLVSLNTIVSQGLSDEKGIVLIGPKDPAERGGIFNFYIPGVDPFLVVDILHRTKRIMVRCGKHCAHSWYNKGKTPDSIRASFYIYNTPEEAEEFVREIKTILKHYKK